MSQMTVKQLDDAICKRLQEAYDDLEAALNSDVAGGLSVDSARFYVDRYSEALLVVRELSR